MDVFGNLRKTLQERLIPVSLFGEKCNSAVFKEAHFCVCCVADREKWAVLEDLYQLSKWLPWILRHAGDLLIAMAAHSACKGAGES